MLQCVNYLILEDKYFLKCILLHIGIRLTRAKYLLFKINSFTEQVYTKVRLNESDRGLYINLLKLHSSVIFLSQHLSFIYLWSISHNERSLFN